MLTWQDLYIKTQRLAKDSNADVLIQLKQDLNTGYHMFNQKLARYYSRKQQFTDLINSQQVYQTPVDNVRIIGMTALVSPSYEIPLKEIRSEYEWRQIISVKNYKSNWPVYYFVQGKDLVSIWPVPSQTIANGMRYYYQPQDHDMTIDDVTSTTTGKTVTVANNSVSVSADTDNPFSTDMASLGFQVTGQVDVTWYNITSATSSSLMLEEAYVGVSGSGKAWRIGQLPIIPQEYQDAPMHWALFNYHEANGNSNRSQFHKNQYDNLVMQCQEDYSSSSESSVIDEGSNEGLNMWVVPPPSSQT